MKKFFIYTLLLIFGISLFADEPLLDNEKKSSVENGSYKVVFTYTNLLPLNYQKKSILFTVYKNGIKIEEEHKGYFYAYGLVKFITLAVIMRCVILIS